jgi:CelD/BcsL family acetyltransferase involved in cellulose biosynthesis
VVTDAEQVDAALRCGLALEDSGWKGRAGTSVLGTPEMLEFYLRQARQLAAWGHLHLALLGAGEREVAFEYGWIAKGVYHSYKIGYDEEFAACGPGQLLFQRLLASFAAARRVELIDCMGPLDEAVARWATRTQAVGRLVIAPGRRVGRALLRAYRDGWPLLARFRSSRGSRGAAGGSRPGGVVQYRPSPVRLPGA